MNDKMLYEIIGFSGFSAVISFVGGYGCNFGLKKICFCIEQKEEAALSEYLMAADECGAVHILTAVCVMVECTEDVGIKDWFYTHCLKKCSLFDLVCHLTENYLIDCHRRFDFVSKTMEGITFRDEMLRVTAVQFMQLIWKNTDSSFLDSLGRLSKKNIGIWVPGIYAKPLAKDFLTKLEQFAFPALVQNGADLKESKEKSDTVSAITRHSICTFLSELKIKFDSQIKRIWDKLISEDISVVADKSPGCFCSLINQYCSEYEWRRLATDKVILQIEELIRTAEYYDDFHHNSLAESFKYYRPLLYAMNDNNTAAYDTLFIQIQTQTPYLINDLAYLVVLYRCLLVTGDEDKRNKLLEMFDNIYLSNSYAGALLDLMNDVAVFFKGHAKRIKNDPVNQLYLQTMDKREDARAYVIKNWICTDLIYHTFLSIYHEAKAFLEHKGTPSGTYSNPIKQFISLFYGLSTHSDDNIRICFEEAMRVLQPTLTCDEKFKNEEVFGIYTREEQERICSFEKRLYRIQEGLPSDSYIEHYSKIRKKFFLYLKTDNESVLCNKLLVAIGEIQTNSYDIDVENFYNNQLALCLRGYYGAAEVHREKPQGVAKSGVGQGETDIIIYRNGYQFSLIESIRVEAFSKPKLNDHMNRLLVNYDTQGVEVSCLMIFAVQNNKDDWFQKTEDYLDKYDYPYQITDAVKRIDSGSKNTCHHVVKYVREGYEKSLHIFTALINPAVKMKK